MARGYGIATSRKGRKISKCLETIRDLDATVGTLRANVEDLKERLQALVNAPMVVSPNPFILIDCQQESVKSGVSQDKPAQRELALYVVQKLLRKVTAVKNGELTVALISADAAARPELHEPVARLQREYPEANLSLNTVDSAQGREFDISIVLLIRWPKRGRR
ncbi:unnamed protein product [Bursaphelenchus xylophilus]|uniref:(pine wood nematode) hypothetical protein n=1 Tax=Bursaphelenchus xylophilus TaxID=6326 RepID=A0A1I7SEY0_BURXY|nr:unnamed protein product [Bursaphelenchus xylophilus]CAG9113717.1 unnamed protein product [Bursaphelenchus xylophilus]